jgi:beta-lysine 5,6-aminomutase alpha subunit
MSKLNLDRDKIQECRAAAKSLVQQAYNQVSKVSTDSIERASLRLLGLDESYQGVSVANGILDSIPKKHRGKGACYWFGRGLVTQRSSHLALALRVAGGKIKLTELPEASEEEIRRALSPLVRRGLESLGNAAKHKKNMDSKNPTRSRPMKYVVVGSGDISKDIEQALVAVKAGVDCIELERETGQCYLDSVPVGEAIGQEGETPLTQANVRKMREALDKVSDELGRYVRLVIASSGICMPEIAVMGAIEKVNYLLNDSMDSILFRDIDMKKALADQLFSRMVLAHSGVIINTAEDRVLAHAEAHRSFPQALASHFLNEQFSFASKMQEWQMAFTHSFELDPELEDGLLYELAQAQVVRECFPKAPIKYMPPTRYRTGDLFQSFLMDGLFTMVGTMTHQDIQQIGYATESGQRPFLMDQLKAIQASQHISKSARSLGDDIQWLSNGKVVRRARSVLDNAHRFLKKIEKAGGLVKSIHKGYFSGVVRTPDQGIGCDGIIEKADDYVNPVWDALVDQTPEGVRIIPASRRRYSNWRGSDEDSSRDSSRKQNGRSRGRSRSASSQNNKEKSRATRDKDNSKSGRDTRDTRNKRRSPERKRAKDPVKDVKSTEPKEEKPKSSLNDQPDKQEDLAIKSEESTDTVVKLPTSQSEPTSSSDVVEVIEDDTEEEWSDPDEAQLINERDEGSMAAVSDEVSLTLQEGEEEDESDDADEPDVDHENTADKEG